MLHLVWSEMPRRSYRGHTYNTGAPQSRGVYTCSFGWLWGPGTHRRILHTPGAKTEGRVLTLASSSPVNQKIRRIIVADVMVQGASCGWLRLKREFRCVPLDHVTRRRGDVALPSFWVAELKICTITHYQGAYLPSERLLGRPQLITSR